MKGPKKEAQSTPTPYEKYEALVKLTHRPRPKKKIHKLQNIIVQLEKLCCKEEAHLRNALCYAKKLLSKKHGK
jgi:hypothetical protein